MKSIFASAFAIAAFLVPAIGAVPVEELSPERVAGQNVIVKGMHLKLALVEALGPERLDEVFRACGWQSGESEALDAFSDYRRLLTKAEKLRTSDDPGDWLVLNRVEFEMREAKKEVWKEFDRLRRNLRLSISLEEARLEHMKKLERSTPR